MGIFNYFNWIKFAFSFNFCFFDKSINYVLNLGAKVMLCSDNYWHKIIYDEILEKYVDVSFGEFKVNNDGYFSEASLDITVKNKAEKQCTYYITIEAVDANGARIETDMIYADRLGAGQEIYLKAFEYVDQEKLNQFKNATFRVLEINKYDY